MSLVYYKARVEALKEYQSAAHDFYERLIPEEVKRNYAEVLASYQATVLDWEKKVKRCKARDHREFSKAEAR